MPRIPYSSKTSTKHKRKKLLLSGRYVIYVQLFAITVAMAIDIALRCDVGRSRADERGEQFAHHHHCRARYPIVHCFEVILTCNVVSSAIFSRS